MSKKFEQERMLLEEKVVKPLLRTEKEMIQAEAAIGQIKTAVKSNSQVALLSNLFSSFTKSMQGTKELIGGIQSALKERGVLERSIQAFRNEIANKIIRTIETQAAQQYIEKLEFGVDPHLSINSKIPVNKSFDVDNL